MKTKETPVKKESIKGEIIGILVCLPFLLLGLGFIAIGKNEIAFTRSCTAVTTGKITAVSSKREWKLKSNGKWQRVTTYTADYSYKINGKEQTGRLVTRTYVKKNRTLKIYYDPDDPQYKYIKGFDDSGNVFVVIVGIVWDGLFLLIIFCLLISIKRKKFNKNNDNSEKNV